MILFHGTDREFEAFSSEHLNSNPDRHANGNLGVWVTTSPELGSRFGKYLLAVETPGDETFDLPISDLSHMAGRHRMVDDVEGYYRDFAKALGAEGYHVIAIREVNGTAPTRVLIDPEACRIVDWTLTDDPDGVERVSALATEENDFAHDQMRLGRR